MKLIRVLFTASFLAILPAASIGCGSDETSVDDGKAISSLEIMSGIDTLAKGSTVKFQAMAKYADGTSSDVTDDAETVWNTDDPETATVAKDGTVTAVDEGTVEITATYKGKSAGESFIVTP